MITRRDTIKLLASACGLAVVGCNTQRQPAKEPSMTFRTIKIAGKDAIATLGEYRSRFADSGEYPFLIGDEEDLRHIQEAAEVNDEDPSAIVQASRNVELDKWIANRRAEAEERCCLRSPGC